MHQGTCCSSKDQQSSPQLPSDSSIQLWLFNTPLPAYSLKSPGGLVFLLFLEATMLDSGTLQDTLACPMHGVVCCRTPNVPVTQKLGLRDRSKYLNGGIKQNHKETAHQGSPSAHSHYLSAEIDSLQGRWDPASSPACLMAH